MGDIHFGTKACDERRLKETIFEIKNTPNCYWIGCGDYAEFINFTDKRFEPEILADWIKVKDLKDLTKVQADYTIEKLEPIKDKCLGLIKGNHEATIEDKYHFVVHEDEICKQLKLPNLTDMALINIFFRPKQSSSYLVKLVIHHPNTSIRGKMGGKVNRAIERLREFDADILILPHFHFKVKVEGVTLGATTSEEPNSKDFPKFVILSGSYLRSYLQHYSTYAQRWGLSPVALGSMWLDIWQKRERQNGKDFFELRME